MASSDPPSDLEESLTPNNVCHQPSVSIPTSATFHLEFSSSLKSWPSSITPASQAEEMEHVQTLAERIGKSFREQVSLVELLKTKAAYLTKNDQYKWLPPTYDEIVKQDPGVVKHEIDILNDRAISEGPSFQDPHHQLPNSPSSNAPSTPTGSIVFTPPGSPTPAFISRTANEMATTAPPTQTRFKLQSTSTALKEEPYDLPGK